MNNSREYCSSPTMDNLETVSNVSDGVCSNLSSLSGLTGYEEELYDLRHLIKLPSSSPRAMTSNDNTHGQFDVFEERIKALSTELQNALKLNEKYKADMSNLERKTELAFHEKFERLMRHNAQLEAQLSVANDRVHSFLVKSISDCDKLDENGKISELELKLTRLQKQDFELHSKLDLLQSEVMHWQKEAEAREASNSRLKLEVEEMKVEVSTKTNSVEALKSKIVELHLEMQGLSQDNVRTHNSLAVTGNELDSFKKSEKWYKEQLHQCRAQKSEALEEISKLHSVIIAKDRHLNGKTADLTTLKNNFEELQFAMVQEKQKLLKATQFASPVITVEAQNPPEDYESTIESFTRELVAIKDAVNEQQTLFEAINKQNSELIARNTTLQKNLNDKEICISGLEIDKKDLNAGLDILSERLKQMEGLLMKTANEKAEIQVSLGAAHREKREIEDAVKTIRENFSKFAASYNRIKEELNEKNKTIFRLQNENFRFNSGLKELQETQQKVCEVDEINRKLNQHILELQREQANFNSCSTQLIETKRKVEELREVNLKLQIEADNFELIKMDLERTSGIKEKLESEVISHQKLTNDLLEELQTLKQNISMVTSDLQLKNNLVHDLKQELNNLKASIALYQETNQGLMETLNTREKSLNDAQNRFEETRILNAALQTENLELKDKLGKFVANNFNGFTNRMNNTDQTKKEELELWLLGILEWICANLLEIQACNDLKQAKFISTCPLQWDSKKMASTFEKISKLLVSISSTRFEESKQICQIGLTNQQLKQNMARIKSEILERLACLEDRCHLLDKRQEEDVEVLRRLKKLENERDYGLTAGTDPRVQLISVSNEKLQEELKQLKISYKAKEMENNEKRKRYEVNNRTLLKKVKEHMRGRNSAEKRCSYLQELYNNVFDELNSYKLQESSKIDEIQNLQSICENYKNINAKMKQDLLRMEKELSLAEAAKALVCIKCIEYESLQKNCAKLESCLKIHEDELKEKEGLITKIQVQIQQIILDNTTLQKENTNLLEEVGKLNEELNGRKEDVKKLELTLEKERKTMEEVQKKLLEEQKQLSTCITQLESAQQLFQHTQEKNKLNCEEIEMLNSKLSHSKNELDNFKAQNKSLEENWARKESLMQTFVMNLQSEIQILQNDLISVRSDKHFLQRLCGDLKLALQTSMNQSKILKKHVETVSSETKECNSLPDPLINLPSPSKYDDAYINQLLKQSSAPPTEKPLGDLQNCLNSLKNEMICLRKQVTDRAGYRV